MAQNVLAAMVMVLVNKNMDRLSCPTELMQDNAAMERL